MSSILFYQQVVGLDRELHSRLKIRPLGNLAFAGGAPAVPVLSTEFAEASREYPIVFLRNAEGAAIPVVLTGAPGGNNLYVDNAGQWQARYVPAYVRRYPFVFAETGPDQLTVCIDEACPGLNEHEGTPLFDEAGEASPALQQAIGMLTEYQRQAQFTQAFVQRLEAAGLLMQADAHTDMPDGRTADMKGIWIVDEARFRALDPDTLQAWFASGELGLVYAHLISLANLTELARRQPAGATSVAPMVDEDNETAQSAAPAELTH